ncbi:MAG: hypothetical protein ACI959_000342 [Limisphaerales bacterium]|jgi:hypothetical protein
MSKLEKYSLFAAAMISTQLDAKADVIQVNLDPDIDVGSLYNFDIEGDGVTDYTFREDSISGYSFF